MIWQMREFAAEAVNNDSFETARMIHNLAAAPTLHLLDSIRDLAR